MRRVFSAGEIGLVLILTATALAAPWGYRFWSKQFLDCSFRFDIAPSMIDLIPWSAPITASFWTADGKLVSPWETTTPAKGGVGDSVLTIPPGGLPEPNRRGREIDDG